MSYRKTFVFFLIILIVSTAVIGCGGSKGSTSLTSESESVMLLLNNGSTVDVSSFSNNNKTIYTVFADTPSGKPESDDSMVPYQWTLETAAASSKSLGDTSSAISELSVQSGEHIYSSGQIAINDMMRKTESKFLASGKSQLQKSSSIAKNTAASMGSAIEVGTTWTDVKIYEFTSSSSSGSLTTIATTCKYISDYAYIFLDDEDTSISTDTLAEYGEAFDTIYETDHKHFGTENDVDGNGKVIIVFSSKLGGGVLGYFYSADKYAYDASTNPESNQGDIFYVTDEKYDSDTTDAEFKDNILGTLAHEFQHMIYFDQHYNKGVTSTYTWLNEALSQAAEYYCGYTENHLAWITSYLTYGACEWLSLTYWTDDNYGYGALFIRYLIDQYGDDVIKNMCSTDKVGIAAVESATGTDFNTIFKRFARALVLSGTSDVTNSLYKFTTLDLPSLQTSGRGGLLPYRESTDSTATALTAGNPYSYKWYPYCIWFFQWSGTFGTMKLSGDAYTGAALGLSK